MVLIKNLIQLNVKKNIKSIAEELIILGGTWNVRPALTPPSGNTANNIKNKDTNTNRKLNAFNLGNIISEGQGSKGIGKLPNPPIKIGMIIKDVVNNPWNVIIGLYCGGGHKIKPGEVNSILNIRGKP